MSIIEIVIATAMISMAVIAALSLTSKSQSQNVYSRQSAEASKYATQIIDWVRSERNLKGWATINAKAAGTYCLNTIPSDFTTLSPGACLASTYISNTIFTRTMIITKDAGKIIISVEITWDERTPRSTIINLELTQW